MVGGDAVYDVDVVPEGLLVPGGHQGRLDRPFARRHSAHVLCRQEQVVRGDLASDLVALLFRPLDYQDLQESGYRLFDPRTINEN